MPMRPAWQGLTKLHQKVEQIVESKLILTERRLSRASCIMSGYNMAAKRHSRVVDNVVVQVSKLPVSIATSSIMACSVVVCDMPRKARARFTSLGFPLVMSSRARTSECSALELFINLSDPHPQI